MTEQIPADSAPQAFCPPGSALLTCMLSRNFGSGLYYDSTKRELAARCVAEGYVWDDSLKFGRASCSVAFYRRVTTNTLPEIALEHGLQSACGTIKIAAGLEPQLREYDGEKVTRPPIEIDIGILNDDLAYKMVEDLLQLCVTNDCGVKLSLEFSNRGFTKEWMRLGDVDTATKSIYPIVWYGMERIPRKNTKVNIPEYEWKEKNAGTLTFAASSSSIKTSVSNSEFSILKIRLNGKICSQKLSLISSNGFLDIVEYPDARGWRIGYATEAFPGSVSISKHETYNYCHITLYATRDNMNRLVALLSGMTKGDWVKFDVSIITEGWPLQIGECKDFNVTEYTPFFTKAYS